MQSAVVLHGPCDLRIEERPRLPPGPGECQVEIQATGLCGSDLHYYTDGRNGTFAVQDPLVLGHEASGIITAIGPDVSPALNLKLGDRVAIECGKACGHRHSLQPLAPFSPSSDSDDDGTAVSSDGEHDHIEEQGDKSGSDIGCDYCSNGRYNLCGNMRFCSSAKTYPHLDGTLQTSMNHSANLLHRLPDTCTYEQAALAEPLSVVLHAARRVGLVGSPAETLFTKAGIPAFSAVRNTPSAKLRVLVMGTGAVGFLAAALVRTLSDLRGSAPVTHIAAMDLDSRKLDALRKAGYADSTFTVPPSPEGFSSWSGDERLKWSRDLAHRALDDMAVVDKGARLGYDFVFECTGAESCIQMGIYMARTGGKLALVGMGSPNPILPLGDAAVREVDLVGVFRYANTWPDALGLLASKTMAGIDKVMVTHKYPLEKTKDAFQVIASGRDDPQEMVLKVIVGPNY